MTTRTTTAIAESVGALLQQSREEAGLSRAAVAQRSKIPERYITMFEEEAHGSIGEDVYSKIYLKAYGKFLGFDSATLVDLYRRERERLAPPPPVNARAKVANVRQRPVARRHPTTSVPTSAMLVTPKLIQGVLLALAGLGVILYFGFEVKKIIAPPAITLVSPQDGLVTTERNLVIEGRTEPEAAIRINGKQVSPDSDGNFRDSLDLQEGLNEITVTGAKKHSREQSVTRRVIVAPKQKPTAVQSDPVIMEEQGL